MALPPISGPIWPPTIHPACPPEAPPGVLLQLQHPHRTLPFNATNAQQATDAIVSAVDADVAATAERGCRRTALPLAAAA